jgi:CDP-glucose 4,6-dehydratase
MLPHQGIFKDKKVLITGNTGFKGAWLSFWLSHVLEANVYGLSNGVLESPSLFECLHLKSETDYRVVDVRNFEDVMKSIQSIQPDFVFHLAAQSLVRTAYEDPKLTVESNTLGTLNILEALRCSTHPCTAVMITSDKVYDNVEWEWGYRENDRLGGKDPYSASKSAAEALIQTYYHSYFSSIDSPVRLSIARAGNVIGGGDWAKDRIVPDIFRAWSKKESVEIRNPNSTRPWQHVLEPLSGYLSLADQLSDRRDLNGEAFNFGPAADKDVSVQRLLEEMKRYWENGKWKIDLPEKEKMNEAHLLRLNCDKALNRLSWKPTLTFRETIQMTSDWYSFFYERKGDIEAFTTDQITKYMTLAKERNREWC